MTLVNLGTDITQLEEEQIAPEQEWDLRIIAAEMRRTKADDRDMIVSTVVIEAPDDYQPITTYMVLPNEDDFADGRKAKNFLRSLKRYLKVFDIEMTAEGFNVEDMVGSTGSCLVGKDILDDGREVNILKLPRFVD